MNAVPAGVYLSVEQVALRYNVSKDTIWRWRREGDFPKPVKLGGKTSRWRLADIEAWEATCAFGFVASGSAVILT
ncbi:helix-turn-helix domain-containing protein [Marivita sp. GX14005]|uniref:helix-turn-helix transcriptional regulator n=1 Tax=Marivita sp. GX14005 TaxID=2942276 RepID=UPI00201859DC|nr:helix-turn-helix domain-containing protein [Marivita sp. GX14005]MCL3882995.1 helix-turn-helix domain-containing protein [Marivita sp. GX14005]